MTLLTKSATWQYRPGSYRLSGSGPKLHLCVPAELAKNNSRPHAPLSKHSGLARDFAELARPADYERFANAHGLLTVSPRDDKTGEPIKVWEAETAAMAAILAVHEATTSQDGLLTLLASEQDKWRYVGRNESLKHLGNIDGADVFAAASALLTLAVNAKLANLPIRLTYDEDANQYRIVTRESNMLSMLWVQLINAIQRGAQFAMCSVCPHWFEVTREDRIYCGRRCRLKAYRERKGK